MYDTVFRENLKGLFYCSDHVCHVLRGTKEDSYAPKIKKTAGVGHHESEKIFLKRTAILVCFKYF